MTAGVQTQQALNMTVRAVNIWFRPSCSRYLKSQVVRPGSKRQATRPNKSCVDDSAHLEQRRRDISESALLDEEA